MIHEIIYLLLVLAVFAELIVHLHNSKKLGKVIEGHKIIRDHLFLSVLGNSKSTNSSRALVSDPPLLK